MHRDEHHLIAGTIRDGDGPLAGVLVRAFTVCLRDEEQLGNEVATDADGRYSISPEPTGDEVARPNVRVAVFDPAGHELASSPVHFGVEGTGTIDLTLPGANGASEFERHIAALTPLLRDVSLSDVNAADVAFLVGATGIPAADLEGLVDASARAATADISGEGPYEEPPALPVEVFYAWYREGLPLEPAALLQSPTDELIDALRRAVDTGVAPARIGDDLENIRTRIEQLKLGHTGPLPGLDAPEEIRELPDVTIRVRERRPGFFEATFKPTDPLHIARNGYTLDTKRGLRGHTLSEVLDRAEANWRQNYPSKTRTDA